ncbi:MAG TPA: glycosyltransferase, partial [Actinospica sp.]|nr:glycosyltransferase [Actinospica sp.]
MTRVLLVSHYYPPHLGGVEGVVHQEAVRLAASGAEVTVLTSGPRSSETVEQGVRVVRVASWNGFEPYGIPFPVPLPSIFGAARRWARWADVVHVHDSFYIPCWAAWFGSASTGTPLVATQHVALSDHPVAAVGLIQRLVYALIGKRVVRRARTVFTVNGRGADFARGLGAAPSAIRHLPNGVDTELFRPARDEAERR